MTWAKAANANLESAARDAGRAGGARGDWGPGVFSRGGSRPLWGARLVWGIKVEGEGCLESLWLNPHTRPLLSPFCFLGTRGGPERAAGEIHGLGTRGWKTRTLLSLQLERNARLPDPPLPSSPRGTGSWERGVITSPPTRPQLCHRTPRDLGPCLGGWAGS